MCKVIYERVFQVPASVGKYGIRTKEVGLLSILNCPYPLRIFLLNPRIVIWNLCSLWNWSATSLSPAVLDNFWYKGHPCLLTNLDIWIRWRCLVVQESWLWVAYHLHLDTFIWTGNLLPVAYGRGRSGGPRTGTFWGQWKAPGVLEILKHWVSGKEQ